MTSPNSLNPNMTLDQAVPTESKFLKKDDVPSPQGADLTIEALGSAEMDDDGSKVNKVVIHWTNKQYKPMVLNKTNKELLKHFTGAETVGQLIGVVVNVYNDPTVSFGGKMTGGLRIRGVQAQAPVTLSSGEQIDPAARHDDIPY